MCLGGIELNRGEMVTAVRDEIDEPTEGFIKNTEIYRWLNKAVKECTRAAKVQGGPQEFDTVIGTADYALASDFLMARRVEVNGKKIEPGNLDDRATATVNSSTPNGFPSFYWTWAGRIYFDCPLDAVYPVKIWYYKKGIDLATDESEPLFDDEYHDLPVLYAVAQAKRKDNDPSYSTYKDDYTAGKNQMIAEIGQEDSEQAESFPIVEDDWED